MPQICICNTGPPEIENIVRSLDRLDNSIQSRDTGSAVLGPDPSCECSPCLCATNTVPWNANVAENDYSDKGLLKKLSSLVRQARRVQTAHEDCVCADRPLHVERIPAPDPRPPSPRKTPADDQQHGDQHRDHPDPEQPRTKDPLEATPSRPYVSRGLTFRGSLPLEVRFMIYDAYFQVAVPPRRIAAVRFRQGEQQVESRLRRSYQPRNRPRRGRVDPARLPADEVPFRVSSVPIWLRETATFTYEPAATDEELQQWVENGLTNLFLTSRDTYEEAASVFYTQNFHFTGVRDANRIPADRGSFYSILAAEAFLRNRRYSLPHIREIELDMWRAGDPREPGAEFRVDAMELASPVDADQVDERLSWPSGLDRLSSLATALNDLPNFRHLRLNFRNRAPSWHFDRVFDPRDHMQFTEFANYAPWVDNMVRINPQQRLSINMNFRFTARNEVERRRRIDDAAYFIRVLRNYLLINAQALNIGYQGIRVRQWNLEVDDGDPPSYGVIVESDDQWVGGDQPRHRFHLLPPEQLEVRPGFRQPDVAYMAQSNPPAEVPPPPPPTPPRRQRVAPERSVLDESDDEEA